MSLASRAKSTKQANPTTRRGKFYRTMRYSTNGAFRKASDGTVYEMTEAGWRKRK